MSVLFFWIFKHPSHDVYLYQLSICDFASENGISNSIGTKCIVHQVSDQVLPFVSVETKVILTFQPLLPAVLFSFLLSNGHIFFPCHLSISKIFFLLYFIFLVS